MTGLPVEDAHDLYEHAPCGYLSMLPDGRIIRVNATFATWMGCGAEELLARRFADLLSIGTRIFYETHGAPMLRLQGRVDELALELKAASGLRLPVFASGIEHVDPQDRHVVRLTFAKAVERRRWERELVGARAASDRSLEAEKDAAALREQFIAVLGHDLRNPLASIAAGMTLLRRRETLGPDGLVIVDLAEGSVERMSAIIDDVLDFARGRLGGGATLAVQRGVDLQVLLAQVTAELRLSSGRAIDTDIGVVSSIDCDPSRIGQLVSNLLGNALTHGSSDTPVRLGASFDGEEFVVFVANEGPAIAPAAIERLFQPFVRGQVREGQAGLGLGLYIASEIARAHAGTLQVVSSDEETRFTLRMPIRHASTAG